MKTIGLVILLCVGVVGCELLDDDYQIKMCRDFCAERGLESHFFSGTSAAKGLTCNCWGYAIQYEEPKP